MVKTVVPITEVPGEMRIFQHSGRITFIASLFTNSFVN